MKTPTTILRQNHIAFLHFSFFIFHFSFCTSPLWSARPYHPVHPDPVLEPWRWRSFPELKGKGLQCMAEDKHANMWFGVDDGVLRYDGVTWTSYTPDDGLYGAPVQVLCAAQDGSVYAGTNLGISRFQDGSWRREFPPEGDLTWRIHSMIAASDGSLWAATSWGALRLGQEQPTLYTTAQTATALQMHAPHLRFAAVPDSAAPAYPWPDTGAWRSSGIICALAPGGPAEAAGLKLGDRLLTVDGRPPPQMRLSGPAGTQVKLTVAREGRPDTLHLTVTREKVPGTFHLFSVYALCESQEGEIWFGVEGGEIVRYSPRTPDAEAWRLFTSADGLGVGYRPQIAQAPDGTIWVASVDERHGVNRFDGRTWTHFRLEDVGGSNRNYSILATEDGILWVGGPGALHAYRSRSENTREANWTTYWAADVPIPAVRVVGLLQTSDGALWIAGLRQEAVRLDLGTARWETCEGLEFHFETLDGAQWFLSQDSSVVHHHGRSWSSYGVEDGLMDAPYGLLATRKGAIWAVGAHSGVAATAWLDPSPRNQGSGSGQRWHLKTHLESSRSISPSAVYESLDGALWFGVMDAPGGVLQYDGEAWRRHTPQEGAPYSTYGIAQTSDGTLWFGGIFGLHRFGFSADAEQGGRAWTTVVDPEQLAVPSIDRISAAPGGDLWIGHRAYGAFRYDGKTWTRYDTHDGLADGRIRHILPARDGTVWIATDRGASRFDGRTWTTSALPSGFTPSGPVWSVRQSGDGAIWINMLDSKSNWIARTVRYKPDKDPPETRLTVSLQEVSQPGNTTVAWAGDDPWRDTPDDGLQYAHRLDGGAWSPFSSEKSKVLMALSSEDHTFEVKARDRDFNIDATPAVAHFTVVPPVWRQLWFILMVIAFVAVTGTQTYRIFSAKQKLLDEAEEELQTAHDMQMALMPSQSPKIEGLDIAGRCIPANHVGGDFFQYFDRDDKLTVAVADVTGHAMEAAIPVVMFDGILESQMDLGGSIEHLFGRLNRLLHRKLDRRTFVCFAVGELDLPSRTLRLANGGFPYPYHVHAGEIDELQIDAYPLGVSADSDYRSIAVQLHPGDRVVFCSDGLIEAPNPGGEMFGFDRIADTIRSACAENLSAEETIERIFATVNAFRKSAPQSDDMTCVVLRVEG